MENHQLAQEYIQYNAELKTAICIQHKYAISPEINRGGRSNIFRHFQEIHKPRSISKDGLVAISAYIPTLELVEPSKVEAWPQANGPIPGLELYEDGAMCLICDEMSPRSKDMRLHCQKEHGEAIEGQTWKKQALQTIFAGSNTKYVLHSFHVNRRWFPVDVNVNMPLTPIETTMKQLLDAAKEVDEKYQRELNHVQDNHPLVALTPFHRRTEWLEKFKNKDMDKLIGITKKPDKEEYLLSQAWMRTYPYFPRISNGYPHLTLVFTHKLKLVEIKIPLGFHSSCHYFSSQSKPFH